MIAETNDETTGGDKASNIIQLTARVPKTVKIRIKMDAARAESSVGIILGKIIDQFYTDHPEVADRMSCFAKK